MRLQTELLGLYTPKPGRECDRQHSNDGAMSEVPPACERARSRRKCLDARLYLVDLDDAASCFGGRDLPQVCWHHHCADANPDADQQPPHHEATARRSSSA